MCPRQAYSPAPRSGGKSLVLATKQTKKTRYPPAWKSPADSPCACLWLEPLRAARVKSQLCTEQLLSSPAQRTTSWLANTTRAGVPAGRSRGDHGPPVEVGPRGRAAEAVSPAPPHAKSLPQDGPTASLPPPGAGPGVAGVCLGPGLLCAEVPCCRQGQPRLLNSSAMLYALAASPGSGGEWRRPELSPPAAEPPLPGNLLQGRSPFPFTVLGRHGTFFQSP